jgi:hypothetical protein
MSASVRGLAGDSMEIVPHFCEHARSPNEDGDVLRPAHRWLRWDSIDLLIISIRCWAHLGASPYV